MKNRRAAALCAAALLATLLPLVASAQDAATKKAPPATAATKPKPKANMMTRDELRACMNEQDRLQALRGKIEQDKGALDRQKADVQAMDADVKKRLAAVESADDAARKALMEDGAKLQAAAADYNAKATALRQQAEEFESGRTAWFEQCTNKSFDEMDEAAIKKERNQAAASGAKK